MNEIEQKFIDAFYYYNGVNNFEEYKEYDDVFTKIEPQSPIGIYIVDFLFYTNVPNCNFVVEIDGQESHKTKEQRYKDYTRERFLQADGFVVIRFTASEVYVNANKCVDEFMLIVKNMVDNINTELDNWYNAGKNNIDYKIMSRGDSCEYKKNC